MTKTRHLSLSSKSAIRRTQASTAGGRFAPFSFHALENAQKESHASCSSCASDAKRTHTVAAGSMPRTSDSPALYLGTVFFSLLRSPSRQRRSLRPFSNGHVARESAVRGFRTLRRASELCVCRRCSWIDIAKVKRTQTDDMPAQLRNGPPLFFPENACDVYIQQLPLVSFFVS